MKVCVTGANGFVGRVLVERILNKFEQVSILTRKDFIRMSSPRLKLFKGDLTNEKIQLSDFLDSTDIVFHCAGEIHDEEKMKPLHVDGTQRLIEAVLAEAQMKKKKIHFVQLSSVGVYGKSLNGSGADRVVTENSVVRPVGEYEITKTASDLLLMKTDRPDYLSFSILRPSNVIGPNMPTQSFYKMVEMIKKRWFFYVGKTRSVATYVHVDDVADALILLATNPKAKNRIYNLSNDCFFDEVVEAIAKELRVSAPQIRISELLARALVTIFGKLPGFPLTSARIDALVARTKYPIDQIQKELGFEPKKDIPISISEIIRDRES